MRKESQQHNTLPDGSLDLRNGVIGPSLLDKQHFNSIKEPPKIIRQSLSSSENSVKRLVRKSIIKAIRLAPFPITGLVALACSGGGNKNTVTNARELEKQESGYALPFPEGETWFLTTGPHGDGWSRGTKYAIDIAPPEGGFCPADGRKFTIDNRVVTASASGEVIIKGDDKNRSDPHHSEIRIKDKSGLTQVYIHVDNTKVKLGDKVKQGNPLGNPSCEFPPGGRNTGPHVHVGLMKDGVAIPINRVKIGGWTIHENGTMTKEGEETRTADIGRYGENSAGIRNDLPNNSNRAVVAGPKDPIPPITGQITSKEVFPATPTPKPTETPYPTPKPTETPRPVEKPKSVEYQALNASLEHFLSILSTTQGFTQANTGYKITSSVVSGLSSFPKNEILDGKQVSQDGDLLKIRWEYSETQRGGGPRSESRKTLGEAEIKNLKVGLGYTAPVSDADRANGIQWKGQVVISFINRYRVVLPKLPSGGYYAYDQEWAEVILPQPTGPFSPWKDVNIGFPPYSDFISNIILRNGQWEFNQGRIVYPISIYSLEPQSSNPCVSWLGNQQIPGCQSLLAQPKP